MKKAIALILAMVMCLSLCACGSGDENTVPQNTTSGNPPSSTTTPPTTTEEPVIEDPLLQYIYGEWYLFESDCEAPPLVIDVKEDGTCRMGGKELTWKYSHSDHNGLLWINVFDDSICKYCFAFDGEAPKESMSLGVSSAEGSYLCGYLPTPSPVLKAIFGEWNATYILRGDKESVPAKVIIREDGTCTVGDTDYTWVVHESQTDSLELLITSGDLQNYIYLRHTGDNQVTMEMYGDNWGANFLNTKFFQSIELTVENWRDYFELVTEPRYEKNAFGDLERLVLIQYIALKEEYANKVLFQDVFAEIASTGSRHYITLDAATVSYTLSEAIEEVALNAEIRALYSSNGIYKIEVFGNNYINAADNADPSNEMSKKVVLVSGIENVQFLRVTGSLYIGNN